MTKSDFSVTRFMKHPRKRYVLLLSELVCCLVFFRVFYVSAQFADTVVLSSTFYETRRSALRGLLPLNSAALFVSAEQEIRSRDTYYPYQQQTDFLYFTGLEEQGLVLLVSQTGEDVLFFVNAKNPRKELYDGAVVRASEAQRRTGISRVVSAKDIASWTLSPKTPLLLLLDSSAFRLSSEKVLFHTEDGNKYAVALRKTLSAVPWDTEKLDDMMHTLRGIKTEEEVALIRKAIRITRLGHEEVMRSARPGMSEAELQGIHEWVHKHFGAHKEGFMPIIGSHANGCTLHYKKNNRASILAGELVLMDVGAAYGGYSADITRTFPISGSFTEEQRLLYELVLEAQKSAIALCRPGQLVRDITKESRKVIAQGLYRLGILRKEDEESDEDKSGLLRYFPHGATHHLGLDVHDRGHYDTMEAGVVLTVEPGIYIPQNSPCDPKWWNIAIRIEDDILITPTGHENLSKRLVKEPKEIERLMRQKGYFSRLYKKK